MFMRILPEGPHWGSSQITISENAQNATVSFIRHIHVADYQAGRFYPLRLANAFPSFQEELSTSSSLLPFGGEKKLPLKNLCPKLASLIQSKTIYREDLGLLEPWVDRRRLSTLLSIFKGIGLVREVTEQGARKANGRRKKRLLWNFTQTAVIQDPVRYTQALAFLQQRSGAARERYSVLMRRYIERMSPIEGAVPAADTSEVSPNLSERELSMAQPPSETPSTEVKTPHAMDQPPYSHGSVMDLLMGAYEPEADDDDEIAAPPEQGSGTGFEEGDDLLSSIFSSS